MKKLLSVAAIIAVLAVPAVSAAATVINLDNVTHTILVTEGGSQVEMDIGPGETIDICPEGCFVVMPNGDREVLTGSETLQIEASRGRVF